jgi:hypothetical protein
VLNNHTQNPNRNKIQKNFHNLEEKYLLPARQKGCHPGSKGCKDQLRISKAIYEDCKRRNKNLSIAWIDYQKAFGSWAEESIELVGVNS